MVEESTVTYTSEEEGYHDKVFKDLRHDFKEAKNAKTEIDSLIQEWNDLYYGLKRDRDGELSMDKTKRSAFVVKEIAKQIEWQKPNITEPFLSSKYPVQITAMKDARRGRQIQKWINHEFTDEFDRDTLLNQMSDVMLREGTVWIETSWNHRTIRSEETYREVTMEQILADDREPVNIEKTAHNDNLYNITYAEDITVTNNPDAVVLRNEFVFPDPGARTERDIRFIAVRELMSISQLRELGIIDEHRIKLLEDKIENEEREDTSLGQTRDGDAKQYGYNSDYEPKDTLRKHIKIIKYWGEYDVDGEGKTKPIYALFAENYKVNLLLEDNPMPDKKIPIHRLVYSERPFSLWGNAVAFFLGDNQKVKSGITRGILDNMSLANNGQRFVQRGAIDYVNLKRLNNGYRTIIMNKADGIENGNYNSLPNSVFNTLQMFTKESEDLVGVSSGGMALSSKDGIGKEGQNAQLTMSQQRMAALVRATANTLSKVFSSWIAMAEYFLDDEQILELFEEEELADINAFDGARRAKVKVDVATEVSRNMKLQQYNMLMQQSKVLEEQLPKGAIKNMVADMYELFGLHEEATKLRLYQHQPSEQEIQAQQLQLQNAQLENQKLMMEIGVMEKDVEARYMNAQARMMEAQANYGYKGAQTQEKLAKSQAHQVDAALKPAQVENEINKTMQEKKNSTEK